MFILRANEIHGINTYIYDLVDYIGIDNHVIIICHIHGKFNQTPHSHINGKRGCEKCGRINGSITRSYDTNIFISLSAKIHEYKYDYSDTFYINSKSKVDIKCPTHGLFVVCASNHLNNKQGCVKCSIYCPSCSLWRTNAKLCHWCKPKNENPLYKKTKEYAVVEYLHSQLPEEEFIHNKSVGIAITGSHLRPDILFERETYNVIVEVDEFEHKYGYECELKRMYDIIANTLKPAIFIRYNPDHKNSDKDVLIERLCFYLELGYPYIDQTTNLKVEYLFYKNAPDKNED